MAVAMLEDLHGAVEIAVFPKVFAKTEDVWRDDAVVIVSGKVDVREDRVQVICDSAESFDVPDGPPPEITLPPIDPGQLQPVSASGQDDAAALGYGSANGHNANGLAVTDERPSARPRPLEAGPTATDVSPEPLLLLLRVTRTGNQPVDIQVLEKLHALLPQDGPDLYELFLTAGRRSVRISNPLARTRYSPELENALLDLLGPDGVKVAPAARNQTI
jgi:hypothetical protein